MKSWIGAIVLTAALTVFILPVFAKSKRDLTPMTALELTSEYRMLYRAVVSIADGYQRVDERLLNAELELKYARAHITVLEEQLEKTRTFVKTAIAEQDKEIDALQHPSKP